MLTVMKLLQRMKSETCNFVSGIAFTIVQSSHRDHGHYWKAVTIFEFYELFGVL